MRQSTYQPINKQAGFSLIEIMVVVVIIGILMAAVVGAIGGESYKAQVNQAFTDFRTLDTALERYRLDNNRYPTEDQGLKALTEKPTTDPLPKRWKSGGYIKKEALDPWGNNYAYFIEGDRYELISLGRDGLDGGANEDADIDSAKRAEDYQQVE